jgi:preprotein translocase subunit SecE
MELAPQIWWPRTLEWLREMKAEMKKVTWPQRPEVVGTTAVVLVAVIIFGVYLWGCDQIFEKTILFLLQRAGVSV